MALGDTSVRAFLRLLLLTITALGGLGAPPVRAALTRPAHLSGPATGGPVDPSILFTANRSLLGALLAHPARIGSTAEPVLTDLAVAPPHLNNLIVANVTASGASVSFQTDVATNTLLYTASPLTEFSSAALTTTHQQALSGLAAGTGYRLRALAVSADLGLAALPDVVFTTAQAAPAAQPALGSMGRPRSAPGSPGWWWTPQTRTPSTKRSVCGTPAASMPVTSRSRRSRPGGVDLHHPAADAAGPGRAGSRRLGSHPDPAADHRRGDGLARAAAYRRRQRHLLPDRRRSRLT